MSSKSDKDKELLLAIKHIKATIAKGTKLRKRGGIHFLMSAL